MTRISALSSSTGNELYKNLGKNGQGVYTYVEQLKAVPFLSSQASSAAWGDVDG